MALPVIDELFRYIAHSRNVANDEAASNVLSKFATIDPPQYNPRAEQNRNIDSDAGYISGVPSYTPEQAYRKRLETLSTYAQDQPLAADTNVALFNHIDKVEKEAIADYTKQRDDYQLSKKSPAINQALLRYDAGQDTADDRALLIQTYSKDIDNVLKPHAERRAANVSNEFLKRYAVRDRGSYPNVSDYVAAVVQDAADTGYQLKPSDIDSLRNSTVGYWEKVKSGPERTVSTKSGSETTNTTLQDYALGKSDELGKATDNPANRELQRENLRQGKAKLKQPKYVTVEFPDGEIIQRNVSRPDHAAEVDEIINKGLGVVSNSDNPESQQSYVYDPTTKEEKSVTKKVKQKIKGKAKPLPDTPQVRAARQAGYSDEEIAAYLSKGNK